MRKTNNLIISSLLMLMLALVLPKMGYSEEMQQELSGSELWSQNCGRCHNFRGVHEFDDAQWEVIVAHMRTIGNIPGDQARAILKFLQQGNNPPSEPVMKVVTNKMEVSDMSQKMASADISKGKELYEMSCTSCHGMSGKGDGPAAVSLRPKPRNLSDPAYMGTLNDQYLYDVISKGGGAVGKSPFMPGWGTTLSDKDIANIIAYIRSLSE